MDRFKFRVWNIENKNYIYDAIYAYDGNNYDGKDNDGWIYYFGEYIDRNNEYIVEQCTGLKDKNGKFIYENDLIKISGFDRIFQVVWLEEPACWGFKHQKDTSALYFMQGVEKEIIGNIHENKDLLGEIK